MESGVCTVDIESVVRWVPRGLPSGRDIFNEIEDRKGLHGVSRWPSIPVVVPAQDCTSTSIGQTLYGNKAT